MARLLLTHGASLLARDARGASPLHHAVERVEDVNLVREYIACGSVVDARDGEGRTPLFMACAALAPEFVRVLLDAHANPRAVSITGATPLDALIATFMFDIALVRRIGEMLFAAGGHFSESPLLTVMCKAPRRWGSNRTLFSLDLLELLILEWNCDVNERRTNDTRTALHCSNALVHGLVMLQRFLLLLQLGADPNAMDKSGDTPLLTLCRQSFTPGSCHWLAGWQLAYMLVRAGADVRVAGRDGKTPLELQPQYFAPDETMTLWYQSSCGPRKLR